MPCLQDEVFLNTLSGKMTAILKAHPAGVSEYDLLKILSAQGFAVFSMPDISDRVGLFQCHFLLFHFLYRMRDVWRQVKIADLSIHVMNIRLESYNEASLNQNLEIVDPLRDYYLDTKNLEMSEEAVDALLGSFWKRFSQHGSDYNRQQSLAVLGLQDPVNQGDIKYRYRQLVKEYHPDRGGDVLRMQEINKAVSNLKELR